MPARHCIQGRADRRNLASASLIATRSPDPAPTTTKSSRLDGFCHSLHHGQIAIARGTFRTSTPRGFLPWTLSDDDPGAFPRCRNGPSSETLHRSRHPAPSHTGQRQTLSGKSDWAVPRAAACLTASVHFPVTFRGYFPPAIGSGLGECILLGAPSFSSHRLWCSFAQLRSTVPEPMASKAPSMPIVPM
jgi:hypothetical protein